MEGGPAIDLVPKAVDNGHLPPLTPALFPAVHIWLFVCVRMSAVDDAWRCRSLHEAAHTRPPCPGRIPACHSDMLPSLSALRAIGNVRNPDARIWTMSPVRWVTRLSGCEGRRVEGQWRRGMPSDCPCGKSLPRA